MIYIYIYIVVSQYPFLHTLLPECTLHARLENYLIRQNQNTKYYYEEQLWPTNLLELLIILISSQTIRIVDSMHCYLILPPGLGD